MLASVWCTSLRQSIHRGWRFYIFNCIDYMNIYIYIVLCSLGSINSIIKFIVVLYPPPNITNEATDYLWSFLPNLLNNVYHTLSYYIIILLIKSIISLLNTKTCKLIRILKKKWDWSVKSHMYICIYYHDIGYFVYDRALIITSIWHKYEWIS